MTGRRGETRRAAIAAGAIVLVLLAVGLTVTLAAQDGSVTRQLGLALLSGSVVGGALVLVESLLAGAAGRRSEHERLVTFLSSTTDLNGIDLGGRDLRQIYLPGRALVAARLANADLEGAKLFFGDLRHADLTGSNLSAADLSGATLAGANLTEANLTDAVLHDVDLSGARLDRCEMSGAIIEGGRLCDTSFVGTDLAGAVVRSSFLEGAAFRAASLSAADFGLNQYDDRTTWPDGFDAPPSCPVAQGRISAMDLAEYLAYTARRRQSEEPAPGA